ncbi:MAG: hypothetical protein RBR19_03040 [Sedimentisphaerales bacterium]|jgi:hypothetical protein|nr:hypothetical protein [Sedimentisphaerales bacterium]NLT77996.1 hypothetical protein [Planctomycetota bacterium]
MKKPDLLGALKPVIDAFDRLAIPYYIGGSIASSAYGIPRATMDADLIAHLTVAQVSGLVTLLQDQYYVAEAAITNAIGSASSFNLIHLETMVKIDVFVPKKDAYQQIALARRVTDRLVDDDPDSMVSLASPEDVILSKLQWYQMGQGVSDRQWLDILGVIKVQGDSLDAEYLRVWAETLGVHDLWQRACSESGLKP